MTERLAEIAGTELSSKSRFDVTPQLLLVAPPPPFVDLEIRKLGTPMGGRLGSDVGIPNHAGESGFKADSLDISNHPLFRSTSDLDPASASAQPCTHDLPQCPAEKEPLQPVTILSPHESWSPGFSAVRMVDPRGLAAPSWTCGVTRCGRRHFKDYHRAAKHAFGTAPSM
ncbi:hypothetical protein E4U27_001781 [Claviceps purpurea]|nr:hypothetical protein E4U27_001781 [Claviceps purpurea]